MGIEYFAKDIIIMSSYREMRIRHFAKDIIIMSSYRQMGIKHFAKDIIYRPLIGKWELNILLRTSYHVLL